MIYSMLLIIHFEFVFFSLVNIFHSFFIECNEQYSDLKFVSNFWFFHNKHIRWSNVAYEMYQEIWPISKPITWSLYRSGKHLSFGSKLLLNWLCRIVELLILLIFFLSSDFLDLCPHFPPIKHQPLSLTIYFTSILLANKLASELRTHSTHEIEKKKMVRKLFYNIFQCKTYLKKKNKLFKVFTIFHQLLSAATFKSKR